jgi:hypothetical protein
MMLEVAAKEIFKALCITPLKALRVVPLVLLTRWVRPLLLLLREKAPNSKVQLALKRNKATVFLLQLKTSK